MRMPAQTVAPMRNASEIRKRLGRGRRTRIATPTTAATIR